jgi:hypothetical protein
MSLPVITLPSSIFNSTAGNANNSNTNSLLLLPLTTSRRQSSTASDPTTNIIITSIPSSTNNDQQQPSEPPTATTTPSTTTTSSKLKLVALSFLSSIQISGENDELRDYLSNNDAFSSDKNNSNNKSNKDNLEKKNESGIGKLENDIGDQDPQISEGAARMRGDTKTIHVILSKIESEEKRDKVFDVGNDGTAIPRLFMSWDLGYPSMVFSVSKSRNQNRKIKLIDGLREPGLGQGEIKLGKFGASYASLIDETWAMLGMENNKDNIVQTSPVEGSSFNLYSPNNNNNTNALSNPGQDINNTLTNLFSGLPNSFASFITNNTSEFGSSSSSNINNSSSITTLNGISGNNTGGPPLKRKRASIGGITNSNSLLNTLPTSSSSTLGMLSSAAAAATAAQTSSTTLTAPITTNNNTIPSNSNTDNDFLTIWDEGYTHDVLDDPRIRQGRHRNEYNLPSMRISVISYTKTKVLKAEVNEKFRAVHPQVHVTLSMIRKVKREIFDACCSFNVELSSGALSYIYFEKLVLKGVVIKTNRKLVGATCLLIAVKFNEGIYQASQFVRNFNTLAPSTWVNSFVIGDVLKLEFSVFSHLRFNLFVKGRDAAEHFLKLLAFKDMTLSDYLGISQAERATEIMSDFVQTVPPSIEIKSQQRLAKKSVSSHDDDDDDNRSHSSRSNDSDNHHNNKNRDDENHSKS